MIGFSFDRKVCRSFNSCSVKNFSEIWKRLCDCTVGCSLLLGHTYMRSRVLGEGSNSTKTDVCANRFRFHTCLNTSCGDFCFSGTLLSWYNTIVTFNMMEKAPMHLVRILFPVFKCVLWGIGYWLSSMITSRAVAGKPPTQIKRDLEEAGAACSER